MKKRLSKMFFLMLVAFSISFAASAQIYVQIRPTFPVVVRPPQPSRGYVWVNEEWEPNGNEYRYSGGRWEAPSHPGYYRRQGYWKQSSRGNTWVRGGWQQRHKNRRH
jgi:hypothetical protein